MGRNDVYFSFANRWSLTGGNSTAGSVSEAIRGISRWMQKTEGLGRYSLKTNDGSSLTIEGTDKRSVVINGHPVTPGIVATPLQEPNQPDHNAPGAYRVNSLKNHSLR